MPVPETKTTGQLAKTPRISIQADEANDWFFLHLFPPLVSSILLAVANIPLNMRCKVAMPIAIELASLAIEPAIATMPNAINTADMIKANSSETFIVYILP